MTQRAVNSPVYLLRVLGVPRIEGPDGGSAAAWHSVIALRFWHLLATAPRHLLAPDRLVGLLWPDTEAEKARHLLYAAVHTVRRGLGQDVLVTEGDGIRQNVQCLRVEVAEFRLAITRAEDTAAAGWYGGCAAGGSVAAGRGGVRALAGYRAGRAGVALSRRPGAPRQSCGGWR